MRRIPTVYTSFETCHDQDARTPKSNRAAGFTLVEILVVIAIIAILSALTAGAVFKVIGVQRANNTELTVKSASSSLEKQMAFVVNQAKNEVIPPSVLGMAGNDPIRARVIWTKLRIKQEFPMNISEASTLMSPLRVLC